MHPVLPREDKPLYKYPLCTEGCSSEKWCRFKRFEEWDWIVIFVVPLDIKYLDIKLLRNRIALYPSTINAYYNCRITRAFF